MKKSIIVKVSTLIMSLALLSASVQAEETVAQEADWASQEIIPSALKTWGTKNYTFSAREPGKKEINLLGTLSSATELTDDAVVLKDKYELTYNGEKLLLDIIHTCKKDNFLSPTRIESKGEGSDEVGTFVATIANGRAKVIDEDGKESVGDLPEGTITMAAMMRLVTLVSKTPGKVYTFKHALESEEMNLKENYQLEVMPDETITSGDRQVVCSKLKLTGRSNNPIYYWVTKEGVLQRVMIDDSKFIELKNTP